MLEHRCLLAGRGLSMGDDFDPAPSSGLSDTILSGANLLIIAEVGLPIVLAIDGFPEAVIQVFLNALDYLPQ
ncbi:MAG TPA: hypothetical protein PLV25_02220 [Opitutales bacterium]|nr:hypothetical protein [Opitutales bacterium]